MTRSGFVWEDRLKERLRAFVLTCRHMYNYRLLANCQQLVARAKLACTLSLLSSVASRGLLVLLFHYHNKDYSVAVQDKVRHEAVLR